MKRGRVNILMLTSWIHTNLQFYAISGESKGAPGTPPPGRNSYIFMQFFGKIIGSHSHFGSWRPPPPHTHTRKILDPPLAINKI